MNKLEENEMNEEPKITSAMIDAGVALLFDYDPAFSNERDIVAAIYRAMTKASLEDGKQNESP